MFFRCSCRKRAIFRPPILYSYAPYFLRKKQLVVKVNDPEKFTFRHCTRISKEFNVDFDIIVNFIANLVKARHRQSAGKVKTT